MQLGHTFLLFGRGTAPWSGLDPSQTLRSGPGMFLYRLSAQTVDSGSISDNFLSMLSVSPCQGGSASVRVMSGRICVVPCQSRIRVKPPPVSCCVKAALCPRSAGHAVSDRGVSTCPCPVRATLLVTLASSQYAQPLSECGSWSHAVISSLEAQARGGMVRLRCFRVARCQTWTILDSGQSPVMSHRDGF